MERALRVVASRRFLFGCFFLFVLNAALFYVSDVDVGYHVRTGELILRTHRIPTENTFSYTHERHPWLLHQGLPTIPIYLLDRIGGYRAIIAGTVAMAAAIFAFALAAALRRSSVAAGRIAVPAPLLPGGPRPPGAGSVRAVACPRPEVAGHLQDEPVGSPALNRLTGAPSAAWAVFLLTLAVMASRFRFNMRPDLCSGLFFAVLVWHLAAIKSGARPRAWLVVGLLTLWANCHAGFAYGAILVALFCAGELLNRLCGRPTLAPGSLPRLAGLTALGLAAAVAAVWLVNPNGPRVLLLPFEFFTNRYYMGLIAEYARARPLEYPWFWALVALGAMALGAPTFPSIVSIFTRHARNGRDRRLQDRPCVSVGDGRPGREERVESESGRTVPGRAAFSPAALDWSDALPFLAFAYLGFAAVRNILFFAVFAAPMAAALTARYRQSPAECPEVARDLRARAGAARRSAPTPSDTLRKAALPGLRRAFRPSTVNLLFLLGFVALFGWRILPDATYRYGFGLFPGFYPQPLFRVIASPELSGRVFNEMQWGGPLLWQAGPRHKVFIDGRLEAYEESFWTGTYAPVCAGDPAWEAVFARYGINAALVSYGRTAPGEKTLAHRLAERPDWALAGWTGEALLYLRRIPEHAGLIARREFTAIRPLSPTLDYIAPSNAPRVLAEARRMLDSGEMCPTAWVVMGRAFLVLGDYTRAATAYEQSLRTPLPASLAQRDLAFAYVQLGRHREAGRLLRRLPPDAVNTALQRRIAESP